MDSKALTTASALSYIPTRERSRHFMMPELVNEKDVHWVAIAFMNAVNAGAETANRFLPHISRALIYTNKWILARNTLTRVVRLWRSKDNRSFHQNLSRDNIIQAEWPAQLYTAPELYTEMQTKDKPDNITAIGATDDETKINNKLGGDPGGTRG